MQRETTSQNPIPEKKLGALSPVSAKFGIEYATQSPSRAKNIKFC